MRYKSFKYSSNIPLDTFIQFIPTKNIKLRYDLRNDDRIDLNDIGVTTEYIKDHYVVKSHNYYEYSTYKSFFIHDSSEAGGYTWTHGTLEYKGKTLLSTVIDKEDLFYYFIANSVGEWENNPYGIVKLIVDDDLFSPQHLNIRKHLEKQDLSIFEVIHTSNAHKIIYTDTTLRIKSLRKKKKYIINILKEIQNDAK